MRRKEGNGGGKCKASILELILKGLSKTRQNDDKSTMATGQMIL